MKALPRNRKNSSDAQVHWFVHSASPLECGGPYHDNVAQGIREWIEAAGYEPDVTGGGRINYDPVRGAAIIYGFSYGFGRGDHTHAAALINAWKDGSISAIVNDDGNLY